MSERRDESDFSTVTPSRFIGRTCNKYLLAAATLPLIFVVVDLAGRNIIPLEFSNIIGRELGRIWLVLPQHLDAIRTSRGAEYAANYSLFALFLFLSIPAGVVATYVSYSKTKNIIDAPAGTDVMCLLMLLFCASFPILLDGVKEDPTPLRNFSVDKFGLYYFREYLMFSVVYASVALMSVLIWKSKDSEAGNKPAL